ncbi:MAG: STAS/SEC14 domain-containing protein [Planctomycetales bacterium]|nr:STAS/SEC14 domain-containing protein [Planctomycetales bacterium]
MGITVQQESPDVGVMRITGLLKKSEMDAVQAAAAKDLQSGASVKMLIVLENFKGWERGSDWGDMNFYAEHGDKIAKIAIVGDPKHETDWLMFTGAGFRRAPVKYFPPDQLEQARQWLV